MLSSQDTSASLGKDAQVDMSRGPPDAALDMSCKETRPTLVGSEERKGQDVMLEGGWLQVNNTLVPYVNHGSDRLLPLSVLKHAAGLLQDDATISYQRATHHQSACLNAACKEAGVDFRFVKHTKLITLKTVVATGNVLLKELPKENPFEHAEEQSLETSQVVDRRKGAHLTNNQLPLVPYHQPQGFGVHAITSDHIVRKPIPLIPLPEFAVPRQVCYSNSVSFILKHLHRIDVKGGRRSSIAAHQIR